MSDTGWKEVLDEAPIDEKDYVFPTGKANHNTYITVTAHEVVNSFFGHKMIFEDMHLNTQRIANVLKEIRLILKHYWRSKFWYYGHAKDLGVLDGVGKGKPAIVIGSGPSLMDALPYLKDWEGAIFTNTSQFGTLIYAGRQPEYVDVADPRIEDWEMKFPVDWRKSSLITTPGMMPKYLEWWKGQKYFVRIYEPGYELYRNIWPTAYQFIATSTLPFANQPPFAISHALSMGYDPIFLVGCDYGFPYNRTQASRFYKEGLTWHETLPQPIENVERVYGKEYILAENGCLTSAILTHYRNQALRLICLDCPQVISVGPGIIDKKQMPKIETAKELIINQGRGYEHLYRSPEKVRHDTERFLATRKMFFLPFQEGHRFIGLNDWKKELRVTVDILNGQGAGIDYDVQYERIEGLFK